MSTLAVGTIKSASSAAPVFQNSSATEIGKLAHSFVSCNTRSTLSILHSFNISSVTDNGVGDHTVNFSTAHSDADYIIAGTGVTNSGNENSVVKVGPRATTDSNNLPLTKTTSAVRLRVGSGTTEMDVGNWYMVTFT
jgi:hypothetical protein|tara:strand:- start:467 stop:877 length:411 start_codon:yes stop_codon:yes gene_type:complete